MRKGSGWSSFQRTLNTIGTTGKKKNYDNGYFDDDDDDDYDNDDYDDDYTDYNVFFSSQKDLQQDWHQGEPINYDDDDEIDDNDNNDDDE